MDESLAALLREIERFGSENDARHSEYSERMLNIAPDVGAFLVLLIRALRAERVLEIGTSNGYSTLWLAHAVEKIGGTVTTIERSDYKLKLAREKFRRSGLERLIDQYVGDATEFLRAQSTDSFDLILLDSNRRQYVGWWENVDRILNSGGVLVVDNTLSHPNELSDFLRAVRENPRYLTSTVPLGNGEFVALKQPNSYHPEEKPAK